MEKKEFTQFGTFSAIVLGAFFVLTLVMAIALSSSEDFADLILVFVSLTMLVALLNFYRLKITVDDKSLSFSLGIGLVKKKYRLSDIKECRAVRNSPFTGIGIRLYSKGWLYNVSGLGAVELAFYNRASCVRIGTDRPEEVAQYVSSKLGRDTISAPEPFNPKPGYWLAVVVIVVLFFPVFMVLRGKREMKAETENNTLTLTGMYGMSIPYNEIKSIDTLTSMPEIRRRTNGYALGSILKGNFRLADGTDVKLFTDTSSPPFIYIVTGGKPVYISFSDPARTRQLYLQLSGDFKKQ